MIDCLPFVQVPAVLLVCMLGWGLWRLERKVTR